MKFAPTPMALAIATTLSLPWSPAVAQQATNAGETADTLDKVVVTATRGRKAIDRIPGAVSVITRKDMDEQLLIAEDPSQVLATQVPGYAPSRQKMTSFGESMRGRTPLILFDGVPQTNPLRSGAREGYFADLSVIERIEVVSGASAIQGLGATGGIINYISRTPRMEGTRQTVDLKYGTQFRSDDALMKAGYMLEHKRGKFDLLGYIGMATRGVGVDGDGRRLGIESTQGDTQDSKATDFFVKAGYDMSADQRLQVSANQFRMGGDGDWKQLAGNRKAGIPTSATRGSPVGQPPRNRVRTLSADWSDANLAGGVAKVQVYRQSFSATYGAGNSATFQDASIAPVGTLFDQSEIVANKDGLRASWIRPNLFVHGLELTTGFDWLSDKSSQRLARTGRTWVPELDFTSYAPFVQLEYEKGPFTVRGGVRREHATLNVDTYRTLAVYGSRQVQGGERSYTQWVKSLGGIWRFADGWSTFVAYNEGFGLPDVGLVLRAVNRPNQSVHNLISLTPVLTKNREVGLTWAGQAGSFTLSTYDSRSQLGSLVRVDSKTGIGSVARVPIRVKGVEFTGEVRPTRNIALSGTYARTRGKTAVAEGAPLDLDLGARSQGPDKLTGAIRWAVSPDVALRLQASHYDSRDINEGRRAGTANLEEHFRGYTLVDASATWKTRIGDFGLGIENLLDKQYVGYYAQSNPTGTADDYFAGRGRTYTLSWRRSF